MGYSSNLQILKRGDSFLIINPSSGKWDICFSHKTGEVIDRLKKPLTAPSFFWRKGLICVFHLTNRCNLECKYCYANMENKEKNTLSDETITKILNILAPLYESILIEFHGGEPLLCWNKIEDVVIKYHKVKNFYFGIQTNGTLLTQEVIDFIKKYSIRVGVSVDGPQKIHDRNRCYSNRRGSFHDARRGISLFQQNGVPFTTISVVEKPKECLEMFDFFIENRIEKIKLNSLSFQGKSAVSCNIEEYQRGFAREHLKVARKIIEHNKTSSFKIICGNIALMVRNLIGLNGYMCLKSPCGAGSYIIMVDEKGNIYPCEEMYGKEDFIITNIENISNGKEFKEILRYSPIILKLKERKIENISKCKDCIFRKFCGGGCTSNSLSMFGSLKREDVICEYRTKMFEELIWILGEDKDNVILLTKPESYRQEAKKYERKKRETY